MDSYILPSASSAAAENPDLEYHRAITEHNHLLYKYNPQRVAELTTFGKQSAPNEGVGSLMTFSNEPLEPAAQLLFSGKQIKRGGITPAQARVA